VSSVLEREKLLKVAMTLLILGLVGWPPIHMALASYADFSPWKYFGWGMYATPFGPKNQIVHVYVLPKHPQAVKSKIRLQPAHLQMTYGVFQWHEGRFATLATKARARNQSIEVRRLKILRGTTEVERLGAKIAQRHRIPSELAKMIFLVIQPRIHPLEKMTYAEVDAYLFEDDRAKKLGTYRSDEEDLNERLLSFMSLRPMNVEGAFDGR